MMRPLAGAMLGLFVMAVFTSGMIGMPIGNPNEGLIGETNKGAAFLFAMAFVAGLVDQFVINLANRFIAIVGVDAGAILSAREETPEPGTEEEAPEAEAEEEAQEPEADEEGPELDVEEEALEPETEEEPQEFEAEEEASNPLPSSSLIC